MESINKKYYDGFEGEPEIRFIEKEMIVDKFQILTVPPG